MLRHSLILLATMLLACCVRPNRSSTVEPEVRGERGILRVRPDDIAEDLAIQRYRAYLFAAQHYRPGSGFDPLFTPIEDIRQIGALLREQYGFEVTLFEDATESDIVDTLEALKTETVEGDGVLIYFAGHGVADEASGQGFWLPVDATQSRSSWIDNEDIETAIRLIPANHVLLVSDSCFSGSLLREGGGSSRRPSTQARKLAADRSRWVITSGGNEPVADGGRDGMSVFAYSFLRALQEARERFVVPDVLFQTVRTEVTANAPSSQKPEQGRLQRSFHKGGQLVLVNGAACHEDLEHTAAALQAESTAEWGDVNQALDGLSASAAASEVRRWLTTWEKPRTIVACDQVDTVTARDLPAARNLLRVLEGTVHAADGAPSLTSPAPSAEPDTDFNRLPAPARQAAQAAVDPWLFEALSDYREGDPYRELGRSVGMLDILVTGGGDSQPYNTTCTATLIAPDLILTNHHCVPGTGDDRVEVAQLRLGYLSMEIIGETFPVGLTPIESNEELDYSILTVDGVPTETYPPLPIAAGWPADGQKLNMLSYARGRPLTLSRVGCDAKRPWEQAGTGAYLHRCPARGGSDGAPLFDFDLRLVALHSRATPDDRNNTGTPIQELLQVSPVLRRLARLAGPDAGGDLTHPVLGTMRRVTRGTFTMGANDITREEQPPHEVSVSSFYLMESEVTQEMWATVMENPWTSASSCQDCPVVNVSWEEAVAFARAVSTEGAEYRLPTEAEWEYAARGGEAYPFAGSSRLTDVGWYRGNAQGPHPVCQKERNGFGLCDMSGNVWEWVEDWFRPYSPRSGDSDPRLELKLTYRVNRGGSWYDSNSDSRVGVRNGWPPTERKPFLGFRLARSAP